MNKLKQVLLGVNLSFMMFITSRRIFFAFFFGIWVAFIALLISYVVGFPRGVNIIIAIITWIIFGLLLALFAFYYGFAKECKFEMRKGAWIFIKSDLFITPLIIFLGALGIFALINVIESWTNMMLFSSFLRYESYVPYALIMFVYWFLSTVFIYIYYKTNPEAYETYGINVMNSNDPLLIRKSKLYCLLKIIYVKYKREMTKWFGDDIEQLLKCESILKLASLVGILDENDKKKRNGVLKILKDLVDNKWSNEPKDFTKTMERIDRLASGYEFDIELLKKQLLRQTIKKYSLLLVSFAMLILNTLIFIFNNL